MKRAIAAPIIATICLCGCARTARPGMDAAAERYVKLALAVAARDPDSLDFYAGPAAWRSEADRAYRPLADVRHDLSVLAADLRDASGDSTRGRFLRRQVDALLARIDLLGGARVGFDDEARQLFGIVPPPIDTTSAGELRDMLNRQLPGRGPLIDRYVAYRRPHVLPPDRIAPVFAAALSVCRERTRPHLTLPPDESVSVEYVPSASLWSAFTRYAGHHRSMITVNTAFAFTAGDLRDLACHEGYPGHHTISVLQDDEFVGRQHRVEFTIEPLFSPQALLAEATAAFAPSLLFPAGPDDPVQALVERLDPVRLDIARRYLDGRLEFARAAVALESEALTPSAGATLKFVNEYRTYVVTYTVGRAVVARAVDGGDDDARWRAYRKLVLAGAFPAGLVDDSALPRALP